MGFGLLPALQASRPDLQSVLKDTGKGMSAGARRSRLRSGLVVVEVALALVLLAGAGLLLRSFERLVRVEPGFNPDGLLTLQIWLPVPNDAANGRFFTGPQRLAYYDRVNAVVAAVPGARQVALASLLPLQGQQNIGFDIVDRPVAPDEPPRSAEFRSVSPNYFETMQIPFIRGHTVGGTNDSTSPVEAVVNRTMANKYWPERRPRGTPAQAVRSQGSRGDHRRRLGRRPAAPARPASRRGDLRLESALHRAADIAPDPHGRPAAGALRRGRRGPSTAWTRVSRSSTWCR